MLTFFRRIRKVLLDGGRIDDPSRRMTASTSKYLLYAIGEILLVVIGILIALQINNWNEERIERNFEQKILVELHTALQSNVEYLDRGIRENEDAAKSSQLILDYLDTDLVYDDSLDNHFSRSLFWFYPSLTNNAYESLKSYGLHLITSDTIREELSDIYEWKFVDRLSLRQDEYFYGTVAPLLTDWFESYGFYDEMKPLNYDELRKSLKYRHILRTMISNRRAQNMIFNQTRLRRLNLAKMIKAELNGR